MPKPDHEIRRESEEIQEFLKKFERKLKHETKETIEEGEETEQLVARIQELIRDILL